MMSVDSEIVHRTLQTNGINMHIAEAGSGPLVLFLHGFPEFWYSWRKQLLVISKAGFHAVAPDLRGYGGTDAPESPDQYSMLHQVGDVIGLIDALGEKKAILVGHDGGAYLMWHVALLRPDRIAAVVSLGCPYLPRNPQADLVTQMRSAVGDSFYQCRWQTKEYAEEAWEKEGYDNALKALLLGNIEKAFVIPEGQTFTEQVTDIPADFPSFFTEDDLKMYVDNFTKTGVTGAFNYYRHSRLTWELTAPWSDAPFPKDMPVLFVAGTNDIVLKFPGVSDLIQNFSQFVPGIKKVVMLEGGHHFIQWERSEEVNKEILEFLSSLKEEDCEAA